MENASKALLIAGAILLVIALIAIGMMILGQGQDVATNAADNMDALAVQAYNQQFTVYAGRELTAMDAENLKGLCIANGIAASSLSFSKGQVVTFGYDASTGKINSVTAGAAPSASHS